MNKTLTVRIGSKKQAAAGRSARLMYKAGGAEGTDIWNQHVAVLEREGIPRTEDAAMLSAMGFTAVQFQIAWPSVMHADGSPNAEGIARCKQWIAALRHHGLTPIISAYRWRRPLWVRQQGSWVNVKSIAAFNRYTGLLHGQFGREAVIRLVHEEPWQASAKELRQIQAGGTVHAASVVADMERAQWMRAKASGDYVLQP